MDVSEIMTTEVFTCGGDDSLERAAQLMWDHDCGCIPVVQNDGQVIGLVTDRDACMAAYTTGRSLGDLRVSDAISREILSCAPADSVTDAAALMRTNQIRRLPVVNDGRLVGILSLNDIALAAARGPTRMGRGKTGPAQVGETLAAIGAHRCEPAVAVAS
jgi:CBS domain-containing protein